jgi:hypothetical protein
MLGTMEKGEINALDGVKMKAVQFADHTKYSGYETVADCRTIGRLCVLFKAYSWEQAWKA